MAKNYLCFIGCLLWCWMQWGQVENNSVIVDWRQHNLAKYNKFLVNPTYSYVRDNARAVSFWSRVQWTGVDNSPQTFVVNFSGQLNERSGAGIGLYQQNFGLLVDSGLLLNYAYSVPLGEEVKLAFGLNTTLFKRSIDQAAVSGMTADPAILASENDFFFLLMPGMNLSVGAFDFGVYAENLIDYNFSENETATTFGNKIYSGQLGYTSNLVNGSGILQDAQWRTLAYGKTLPNQDFQYGFNSLMDLPYHGWLQVGYNNTFGINGGIGVVLGEGISVGFTYENGSARTNNAFGSTFEAVATIDLSPRRLPKNEINRNGRIAEGRGEVNDPERTGALERAEALAEARAERAREIEEKKAAAAALKASSEKYTIVANLPEKEKQTEEAKPSNSNQVVTSQKNIPPTEVTQDEPKQSYNRFITETEQMITDLTDRPTDSTAVTTQVFGNDSSYKTIKPALGVDPGFYLVANVFANKGYFEEFMELMKNRKLAPQYFIHPDNKYYYVYLAKSDSYLSVKNLQRSHLEGRYKGDKWVLWVKE